MIAPTQPNIKQTHPASWAVPPLLPITEPIANPIAAPTKDKATILTVTIMAGSPKEEAD